MGTQTEAETTYGIGGQRWERGAPGFADAIAAAHANHLRPCCLCQPGSGGVEMYVARLMNGYLVKRMPNTGSLHAITCPSYEPPAEVSGLGQLLGTAIVEDPTTGQTTLKLDFPMTRMTGRSNVLPSSSASSSVKTRGSKLTLRGLLHYLWDQAELTHWQPGFAGRRTWATVRRHLLRAAEHKIARGHPLLDSLYIPEVFSVDQREAINKRRLRHWNYAAPTPGAPQHLMLIIAEVKEIVLARFGYKLVIKHVPDQAFGVDEALFRKLTRCFEPELSLWNTSESLHLLAIATFRLADSGIPTIIELSLFPATAQWLPVEDQAEHLLVRKLVDDGRSFIKCLRYNVAASKLMPSASLIDCGASPQLLVISRPANDCAELDKDLKQLAAIDGPPPWIWDMSSQDIPNLPVKRTHQSVPPGKKAGQSHSTSPVEPHGAATNQTAESP